MVLTRNLLFFLFALSGFSGLVYESIWTHYLKLFLGHAAYAQTLVLAIFMGGMAIGAWLSGAGAKSWKNLLLGYALVEGVIGIGALLFHDVFDLYLRLAYETLLPALGSPTLVSLVKWSSAGLLILPQSILLGMTFPLMSGALIRRFPSNPGASISMLYFTNSIGATAGVLVSGFILVEALGLPGTIRLAGVINILLALWVWYLARDLRTEPQFEVPQSDGGHYQSGSWFWFFLVIALVTGAASFIYEIAWIRMLSLVLGASTH
ncbi:MAG: fused MFS/spermidine synthase, partial [Nitrospira sp.]|nr:fused MFS/spermidine synthase [Nitrospira sp.]